MSEPRKAALVTGGAKRLGREICLRLAGIGYDIALHYFASREAALATAGDIEALGVRCHLLHADLRSIDAVSALVKGAQKAFPDLSLLVNSASVWEPISFRESSYENLRANMLVHVESPYVLCRDFSQLVKQGSIINIVDAAVTQVATNFFPYLLSKKALWSMTEMLACELAPQIRVNAVAPGMILPPEDDSVAQVYGHEIADNPLNHPGTPEDVLQAIEFLLTSAHITGQCIYVDGGQRVRL